MSLYHSEQERLLLARNIVEESVVLLKNEGCLLPLSFGTVAFFGRACYKPNLGGMGSGDSTRGKKLTSFDAACEAEKLVPVRELQEFYQKVISEEKEETLMDKIKALGTDLIASGIIYELFGEYHVQPQEPEVPEDILQEAVRQNDIAIYVLGRCTGGEECDRRLENDYRLSDSEKKLLDRVCTAFPKVVLILNINGQMDVSWIAKYENIKSVLYVGTPGEQGPAAVARILSGAVSPSGKLAFTMAMSYEDYPTADTFSYDKDDPNSIKEYKHYGLSAEENGSIGFEKSPVTLYQEGLYIGYRYFDSFGKEVAYPFGFGLSYAAFEISDVSVRKQDGIIVTAKVHNRSGQFPGREVVQVYVSKPQGRLEQPFQNYAGCTKTKILNPGDQETVKICIPWKELASYDEEYAAWILEPGEYILRIGVSSRQTCVAGILDAEELLVYEQLTNRLSILDANRGKIEFLSVKAWNNNYIDQETETRESGRIQISSEDIETIRPVANERMQTAEPAHGTLQDVKAGKITMDQFVSQMSVEELAVLANGYGSGLPFGGLGADLPCTIKYNDGTDIGSNTHERGSLGYVSPALLKYGIPSAYYKDGPAGVGKIAWPTQMIMACSFNNDLLYWFGAACGAEAEELGVDSWLAPGLNLFRNPLNGRNFEYYSEDPLLAGTYGVYVCKGAAENSNVTACPKHFAMNEQETYRRGCARKSIDAVDSILSERTARELYLKPFEMVIKSGYVKTLMTSFNKINGTFAGGNKDLCSHILRDEWGYQGVVVTDWGDMDIVVDGADAVAAGNDVIMPGGPPVIAQVLEGYEEGRVTREQLMDAAAHLLYFVTKSG